MMLRKHVINATQKRRPTKTEEDDDNKPLPSARPNTRARPSSTGRLFRGRRRPHHHHRGSKRTETSKATQTTRRRNFWGKGGLFFCDKKNEFLCTYIRLSQICTTVYSTLVHFYKIKQKVVTRHVVTTIKSTRTTLQREHHHTLTRDGTIKKLLWKTEMFY